PPATVRARGTAGPGALSSSSDPAAQSARAAAAQPHGRCGPASAFPLAGRGRGLRAVERAGDLPRLGGRGHACACPTRPARGAGAGSDPQMPAGAGSGNLRVISPWTLARTVAHRYSGAADPWRPDLPLRPAVRPATGRTQSHGHSRVAAGRALLHAGELGAGGGKGEGIFAGGLRLIAQPAPLPHPLSRGGEGGRADVLS